MTDDSGGNGKEETIIACFKTVSQYLYAETEENNGKPVRMTCL
jgi:hypothetical protein